MASELELKIVTPFGKKYEDKIKSCVVPGALGQFQLLKDHAAMISAVEVGLIRIEAEDGSTINLATSGGFCEVKDNRIKAIVESAEFSDQIDTERAEKAKARAEERIAAKSADVDVDRAKIALARALNRLRIAQFR